MTIFQKGLGITKCGKFRNRMNRRKQKEIKRRAPQGYKGRFPSPGSQREVFKNNISTLDQLARVRICENQEQPLSRTRGRIIFIESKTYLEEKDKKIKPELTNT